MDYQRFLESLGVDNYLVDPQRKCIFIPFREDFVKIAGKNALSGIIVLEEWTFVCGDQI